MSSTTYFGEGQMGVLLYKDRTTGGRGTRMCSIEGLRTWETHVSRSSSLT